ncbi:MAG: 50S ribosomal protein L5 [Saprospiraceae bacterium]|nr:50S ribosomal protein L5 [Saprospiraceae bacterium]
MSNEPRLRVKYKEQVVSKLMELYQYKSPMQVPRIEKICLNHGVGDATGDKKLIEFALNDLTIIAGQKAVVSKARKSVSNFKLREGMPIGVRVTLRGTKMYEFLDRFISLALPRVRDFKGINDKSFDGRGNYSVGVTEHIIFPEIDIDKVNKITGLDVTIVTTANTDAEALSLLKEIGLPFRNQNIK